MCQTDPHSGVCGAVGAVCDTQNDTRSMCHRTVSALIFAQVFDLGPVRSLPPYEAKIASWNDKRPAQRPVRGRPAGPLKWSGCADSNRGSPVPQTGALDQTGPHPVESTEVGSVESEMIAAGCPAARIGHDRVVTSRFGPASRCRFGVPGGCLLYTSPSPRDLSTSRMPSSA